MYAGKNDKTGLKVSVGKYEQDYYKYKDVKTDVTKRRAGKTDFENKKASIELSQDLNEDYTLLVGYDYSEYDGYYSNSFGTYYKNRKTNNFYSRYQWALKDDNLGYFQYYHNKMDYENQGGMEEKINGLDLQQELVFNDEHKLVAGANWREAEAANESSYAEGGKIRNTSLYVSDNWSFGEGWSLNGGVRYDDHSKAGDDTTWSFGLNKQLGENSHIYANWGQVFKAPTTDDLYYNSAFESNGKTYISKGDPNLKPETGESWTIGYGAQIDEATNIGISYFKADLEDAIDWSNEFDVATNTSTSICSNIDKQKREGMEFTINHSLNDNLSLEGSYTYVKVRNNDAGAGYERDDNQVPNIYRFGVNYKDGQWDSTLSLRAGSGASAKKYVDSSYVTMDLVVKYQQSENLSFYAKAYNLFNEAYAEYAGLDGMGGYSNPAESRRFIIGAEYTF